MSWDGSAGLIRYAEPIHFFRALGRFVEAYRKAGTFHIAGMCCWPGPRPPTASLRT
ncbi:hypothetical protein [Paenibacillus popilliae]|uniref:hypothetical protein n=1 Tax=Paenibacillus popilliae TaxID=78057 RepID=UPI0002FE4CC5|nr:hypothetical protein [Paenibacillus popilliae]